MASINIKNACKKILAIGRNYAEHAAELGNQVPKGQPVVFSKPSTSIITQGQKIEIPKDWKELHHEVELGLVIGKQGKNIPESSAMEYVSGYVLALDMTARDMQNELKKKQLPWLLAKGFDTSCPISDFIPANKVSQVNNLSLQLYVNGVSKQNGNTSDMIFKIPTLISFLSQYFTLEQGDVILTGTPAGVSGVRDGDILEGHLKENENVITSIKFPVIQLQ